jgi:hypothetical protein
MKVRLAQLMLKSESRSPEEVRTAKQTRATESTCLHEDSDANVMTADSGSTLCNCQDARVASPDALQFLPEVASSNVAYEI